MPAGVSRPKGLLRFRQWMAVKFEDCKDRITQKPMMGLDFVLFHPRFKGRWIPDRLVHTWFPAVYVADGDEVCNQAGRQNWKGHYMLGCQFGATLRLDRLWLDI